MKKTNSLLNYKFWVDLFFPNRCPVCKKVIVWNELLCEKCINELPFLQQDLCKQKENQLNKIDSLYAVFEYSGNAVKAVYNLKTQKGLNFAEYAADRICEAIIDDSSNNDIDAVTFVPMSKDKQRLRGYNQAEKFAYFISKRLNKPLISELIVHLPNNTEQHLLSFEQRQKNAELVFQINPNHADAENKNILICDDVVTSGATMNRCASLLKSIGVRSVHGAAICRTLFNERNI